MQFLVNMGEICAIDVAEKIDIRTNSYRTFNDINYFIMFYACLSSVY